LELVRFQFFDGLIWLTGFYCPVTIGSGNYGKSVNGIVLFMGCRGLPWGGAFSGMDGCLLRWAWVDENGLSRMGAALPVVVRYGARRVLPKLGSNQNLNTMPLIQPLRFILLILPLYGFGQVQNPYLPPKAHAERRAPVKRGIWFTPSTAREIRGVDIGLVTANFGGEYPLTIRGVNLNADLLGGILIPYAFIGIPFGWADGLLNKKPDTATDSPNIVYWGDSTDTLGGIRGFSASLGGLTGVSVVKGAAINGLFCMVTRVRGVAFAGALSTVHEYHGVLVGGLMNVTAIGKGLQMGVMNLAREGRGVQVGLMNRCGHLKGIQIGLWNVNNKRRLPLINWAF
jgi:hypothetical protein